MKYLHKKEIGVPLYRGMFVIILTNDPEQLKKHLPEWNGDIYAHSLYENWKGRQGFVMVLNHDHEFRAITPGVITHEAVHITSYIARERGIELDVNNDEPIAYLAEWITDEVYSFMNKHSKI